MKKWARNALGLAAFFTACLVSLSLFQLANPPPASAVHESYSWHTNYWTKKTTTTTETCGAVFEVGYVCSEEMDTTTSAPFADAGCKVSYLAPVNVEGCGAHTPKDETTINGNVTILVETRYSYHRRTRDVLKEHPEETTTTTSTSSTTVAPVGDTTTSSSTTSTSTTVAQTF